MTNLEASSGVLGGGFVSLHASESFLYLHLSPKMYNLGRNQTATTPNSLKFYQLDCAFLDDTTCVLSP